MKRNLIELLQNNPVIADVNNDELLEKALLCGSDIIFVLYGNICTIAGIVERIHAVEKVALVDVDLVEGMSSKEVVVDFILSATRADGIISSKANILRAAKKKNLFTVHRFFLIDSTSYHNLPKQYSVSQADVVEVLPGCMPKVLGWVKELIHVPLIASGLVCEREDALFALRAGAVAISTTTPEVWDCL